MINDKNELQFYLFADMIMNRGYKNKSFTCKIKELITPDYIMDFLITLRKAEYYKNNDKMRYYYYLYKNKKLGIKLGFSINGTELGYGCVIPHYGTIVIGGGNKIGNYCVLHTSTCITAGNKVIGNGLYLSTGAKLLKDISIGDYVSVAANTVVNSDVGDFCLIAGVPGKVIKTSSMWFKRDGVIFEERVKKVEKLKIEMKISK